MTAYPNREHENADKAALRRARTAISDTRELLATLELRLRFGGTADTKGVYVDANDARPIMDAVARLTGELAKLETLRDVREWHAADVAESQEPSIHPHSGGPHRDWLRHDDYLVHRHNRVSGMTEWELTGEDGSPVTKPLWDGSDRRAET